MASSTAVFLARLLGPTIIVVAATEMANPHILTANTPSIIYLNGAALFVSGLALVLHHNRWVSSWPISITLVSWLTLVMGFSRMMWPEHMLAQTRDQPDA